MAHPSLRVTGAIRAAFPLAFGRRPPRLPAMSERLPVIDMSALFDRSAGAAGVAGQIRAACEAHGFFYLVGHGVGDEVLANLELESRRFFARPTPEKMAISMARGGRAWRGYFPVGGELTS